eukprot:CAMPEP_0194291356 /NCGR_PEP_ID=MMETSP0169-20130528/43213_1 /TAXON_ID=218684 /ORGANISM="Corethron pennatum, Strain L29A3" /LENGTH=297 /DNA_ID=CAMNT_0039039217 /DNA_START=132 /DNA_END=1025 /DNA_ORIENTATION=+
MSILSPSIQILLFLFLLRHEMALCDDYSVAPNHKSLVVAMGCFWCGEEAFEHYAPGVVEAVSGYSGGSNENPTYRNHPNHFEVVLVEYDPARSSYEELLRHAWRNIDPFNGAGQFCDRGTSYRPAIFYADESERRVADAVAAEVADLHGWDRGDLAVPLLPRTTFWSAEEYHQDYYQKKPGDYGYYKTGCGRSKRLQQVWGEEVYDCYHDLQSSCFDGVTNSSGNFVDFEANMKQVGEGKAAVLPKKIVQLIVLLVVVFLTIAGSLSWFCMRKNVKKNNLESNVELKLPEHAIDKAE